MKWIAAILMIVNVIIYLRVSDQQGDVDDQGPVVSANVNAQSMLLLKEIRPELEIVENNYQAVAVSTPGEVAIPVPVMQESTITTTSIEEESTQNQESDLPTTVLLGGELAKVTVKESGDILASINETTGDDIQASSSAIKQTQAPKSSDQQSTTLASVAATPSLQNWTCYRVGPFKLEDKWKAATTWVEQSGYWFQPIRSESRELRAMRVYVGPFETQAGTRPTIADLKEKELDHFLYTSDDSQVRISLGYFTQEELANKYVNYLKGLNVDAKSQPQYRTLGPYDWMDVRVDISDRVKLLSKDWGEKSVALAEKPCPPV